MREDITRGAYSLLVNWKEDAREEAARRAERREARYWPLLRIHALMQPLQDNGRVVQAPATTAEGKKQLLARNALHWLMQCPIPGIVMHKRLMILYNSGPQ